MIHIGTSGFSFKDWLGVVYPADLRNAEMLSYYERVLGFDCTELNFTYYSMPTQKTMHSLLEKTSDSFQFLVRTHADMTHNIYADEARHEIKDTREVFEKFVFGIDPLVKAGRLGSVLVQWPTSFYPRPDHVEYLAKCRTWLGDLPVSVEFRNSGWNTQEAYTFLGNHSLGLCVVDEPHITRLMPFAPRVTTDVAYFRFHGRSSHWFDGPKELRYDYLYSEGELREFIPHIRKLEEQSRVTYVAFNNCHAGAAARNALMTKQFLDLIDQFTTGQREAVGGKASRRRGELGI